MYPEPEDVLNVHEAIQINYDSTSYWIYAKKRAMMAILYKNLNPQPALSLNPKLLSQWNIYWTYCPSWTAVIFSFPISIPDFCRIVIPDTEIANREQHKTFLSRIHQEGTYWLLFLQQLFQQFECSKGDSGRKIVAPIKEIKKCKMANRAEKEF